MATVKEQTEETYQLDIGISIKKVDEGVVWKGFTKAEKREFGPIPSRPPPARQIRPEEMINKELIMCSDKYGMRTNHQAKVICIRQENESQYLELDNGKSVLASDACWATHPLGCAEMTGMRILLHRKILKSEIRQSKKQGKKPQLVEEAKIVEISQSQSGDFEFKLRFDSQCGFGDQDSHKTERPKKLKRQKPKKSLEEIYRIMPFHHDTKCLGEYKWDLVALSRDPGITGWYEGGLKAEKAEKADLRRVALSLPQSPSTNEDEAADPDAAREILGMAASSATSSGGNEEREDGAQLPEEDDRKVAAWKSVCSTWLEGSCRGEAHCSDTLTRDPPHPGWRYKEHPPREYGLGLICVSYLRGKCDPKRKCPFRHVEYYIGSRPDYNCIPIEGETRPKTPQPPQVAQAQAEAVHSRGPPGTVGGVESSSDDHGEQLSLRAGKKKGKPPAIEVILTPIKPI